MAQQGRVDPGRIWRTALASDRPLSRRPREWRHRRARPARTSSTWARSAAASGRRPTPAAPGSRSSTRSRSRRSAPIAVAPSNPNVVYVGTGEADMRSQISYGNGMYKSTDAGQDVDAHRPRQHAADRQACSSTRAIPTSSSSRRSATSTAPIPIAACIARATAARRGRRCCSRATTSAPSIVASIRRTRRRIYAVALEHAPSAVERLSAVVRTGQRPLQVHRRRRELAAADQRPADRRRRPHRHRGRAVEPQPRLRDRRCQRRRPLSGPTTPARRSRRRRATRASGDAAGTSARSSSIRRTRICVYIVEHRRLSLARRRPDVRRAVQGIARRRRLSPALDLIPTTATG